MLRSETTAYGLVSLLRSNVAVLDGSDERMKSPLDKRVGFSPCTLSFPPRIANLSFRLILSAVLIVAPLLQVSGLSRSFWLDEVWVANAVLEPTFAEVVYYDGWLNTNPPLFLLLVRASTQLFGVSHEAMRLVPFVFGVMSIFAMAYLALRLLPHWYALVAIFAFVLSPDVVFYAKSLKPYTADVFVCILLLIMGHHYLETRSRRVFNGAAIAFSVFGFLSYQAIMFLPAFLWGAFEDRYQLKRHASVHSRKPVTGADLCLFVSAAVSVSTINYIYFIEPNYSDALAEFWRTSFYHGSNALGLVRYLGSALSNLTSPFFFVTDAAPTRVLTLSVMLIGILGVYLFKCGTAVGQWSGVMLLGLPLLSLVILNVAGQYPITRPSRLTLFIFPVVAILCSAGIRCAVRGCGALVRKGSVLSYKNGRIDSRVAGATLLVLTCIFVGRLASVGLKPYVQREPEEDAVAAIRYLSKQHVNGDLLYVHSTMREHYKFYSKSFSISSGRIVEGNIGWPCCPRGYVNDRRRSVAEILPAEFDRLQISRTKGRVRLLFSGREDHWDLFIRRDEPTEFYRKLVEEGCRPSGVRTFRGVKIDEFYCGSS